MKRYLPIILCFILGFCVGLLHSLYGHRNDPGSTIITQVDTVTIYDTTVIERPVLRLSYIHDTIRTYFTTIDHDTVLVNVPIERKIYAEDSLYYASVSGWRPSLDTLVIYPKETTITITNTVKTPAPRWSFGATAGPSVLATPSGNVHAGLGVTAGLTYRF